MSTEIPHIIRHQTLEKLAFSEKSYNVIRCMKNKRRWYPQQFTQMHSLFARPIVPTPRCQELGPTCLLQLLVPEPSEPHRNPNHRNFGNRQNPSKPGTPQPSKPRNPSKPGAPKPSKQRQLPKPGERNLWNLEPSQDLTHRKRTSSRNRPWDPGTCRNASKPGTGFQNRFPEPGSFPEPPQLAQSTPKSILCKDPIAFFCWGIMHDFSAITTPSISFPVGRGVGALGPGSHGGCLGALFETQHVGRSAPRDGERFEKTLRGAETITKSETSRKNEHNEA